LQIQAEDLTIRMWESHLKPPPLQDIGLKRLSPYPLPPAFVKILPLIYLFKKKG
jgi:hypothetical protein